MKLKLFGIPGCGTVKKTRAWLDERGIPHDFVDFRKTPVEPERIAGWVQALGAKALKNTSGGSYRALPPEKSDWSDEQWAVRFAADPMLIKRPVIELDDEAVMAGFRRPEDLAARL